MKPSTVVATFAIYGWRPLHKTSVNAPIVPNVSTTGTKSNLFNAVRITKKISATIIRCKKGLNTFFYNMLTYSFDPIYATYITSSIKGMPPAITHPSTRKPISTPVISLNVLLLKSFEISTILS